MSPPIIPEWLENALKEFKKREITEDRIRLLEKIEESISKKGSLEVGFCLNKITEGMRFSELQAATTLSTASLTRLLEYFKKIGFVEIKTIERKIPRNETVEVYKLTKKGKEIFGNMIDSDFLESCEKYLN
ncbi:MAG: hypothetical protein HZB67_02025 [Candidatus Aenigmarchaeota archaeon]|nr:hypothetical protein [Candidatus Aenigmarchaeota archaeon]